MIDIGHPAHVHLFKNFIKIMEKKGHEFLITARDKECVLRLLDTYGIKYIQRGKGYNGILGKAFNLIKTDIFMYNVSKSFNPDILIGVNNPYIAHVSWRMRKPSFIFNDTEHAKIGNLVTYPFATKIITPLCYKDKLGKKQVRYNGYHELAYLHPNYFKPNPSVLKELGLKKGEKFFVLRFVSWGASHDIRQKGLTIGSKREIIQLFSKYGKVLISSEGKLPKEFEAYKLNISPEKMHDVLYYTTLLITEGATMATEAAILGTPSLFVNTGYLGNPYEINEKYGLLFQITNPKDIIKKVKELTNEKSTKKQWKKKSSQLLEEKIDVTRWMVNYIEDSNYN